MRVRNIVPGLLVAALTAMGLPAATASASAPPPAESAPNAPAATATTPPPKVVNIVSYANSGSFFIGDVDCEAPPTGVTLIEATGSTNIGVRPGDTLVGADIWSGCFYIHPDGTVTSSGEAFFSGEIKGCGTGTIKIRFENSMGAPDPVTQTRQATGLDVFVKRSGTGGLAGVEGAYRTTTTIQPNLTFTDGFGKGFAVCGPGSA